MAAKKRSAKKLISNPKPVVLKSLSKVQEKIQESAVGIKGGLVDPAAILWAIIDINESISGLAKAVGKAQLGDLNATPLWTMAARHSEKGNRRSFGLIGIHGDHGPRYRYKITYARTKVPVKKVKAKAKAKAK